MPSSSACCTICFETAVDVGDERIAGNRSLRRQFDAGNDAILRVDDHALAARDAAQIAIVDVLEPILADDVVGRITLCLSCLVFGFGDLPDVAEDRCAGVPERIVANRLHFQIDAGQDRREFREPRDFGDRQIAREHDRTVGFVRLRLARNSRS